MVAQPHFLLFCDTHHNDNQLGDSAELPYAAVGGGRWHFVLEQLDGPERLEAADSEAAVNRERLALLSVVRGLEALEQPSQVTLVTTSRYVSRGLRYGLSTWREADYMWERFGEQRPIRNSDLWRRIDTALQFHGVKCRLIQASHNALATSTALAGPQAAYSHMPAAFPQEPATSEFAPGLAMPVPVAPRSFGSRAATHNPPLVVPKHAARELRNPAGIWQPTGVSWLGLGMAVNWWSMAAAWIRWRRGRMQAKPALYGT